MESKTKILAGTVLALGLGASHLMAEKSVPEETPKVETTEVPVNKVREQIGQILVKDEPEEVVPVPKPESVEPPEVNDYENELRNLLEGARTGDQDSLLSLKKMLIQTSSAAVQQVQSDLGITDEMRKKINTAADFSASISHFKSNETQRSALGVTNACMRYQYANKNGPKLLDDPDFLQMIGMNRGEFESLLISAMLKSNSPPDYLGRVAHTVGVDPQKIFAAEPGLTESYNSTFTILTNKKNLWLILKH
ncbi:hypothetical protein IPJ72_03815 [Candidatus Peregrinibacteria bacterium]|nr:MAG: hypothetical protein IPJ72_03815 [Candidatus Peregrinibacteria bacterium]